MFQHLVVPVDGSPQAWNAVPIAARMAAAVDGKLDVVTVVDRLADVVGARTQLRDGLGDGLGGLGALAVEPMEHVLAGDSIAAAIADHVESLSGATVVMSSHGHGRSSAVLGSTTDDLLRRLFGPIVVIGPNVESNVGDLSGPYVVPVDGSARSETIVPIAGAWAVEFGATPWIVEVLDPDFVRSGDVLETNYVHRVAFDLQARIEREVEFEALHGEHPSRAVVDFARDRHAALLFCSTHGRTGLARLRLGSIAAGIVRHATCPVVLYRPPELPE